MQLQITRVAGGSTAGAPRTLQRAARPQRLAAAPRRAVAVKAGLLDFFNQVRQAAAARRRRRR